MMFFKMRKYLVFLIIAVIVFLSSEVFADGNIIKDIQTEFANAKDNWINRLDNFALWLLYTLTLISFTWSAIQMTLRGADIQEFAAEMVRFILVVGFFTYVIQNAGALVERFLQGWAWIGGFANEQTFRLNPSEILERGIDLSALVASQGSTLSFVVFGILALTILLMYAFITAQVLLIFIEGYIVSAAGVVLLGFAGTQWTMDYAKRYFSYLFSIGVKIFAIYLVIGLGDKQINDWAEANKDNLGEFDGVFSLISVLLVVLVLVKMIPDIIHGLLTGASLGQFQQQATRSLKQGAQDMARNTLQAASASAKKVAQAASMGKAAHDLAKQQLGVGNADGGSGHQPRLGFPAPGVPPHGALAGQTAKNAWSALKTSGKGKIDDYLGDRKSDQGLLAGARSHLKGQIEGNKAAEGLAAAKRGEQSQGDGGYDRSRYFSPLNATGQSASFSGQIGGDSRGSDSGSSSEPTAATGNTTDSGPVADSPRSSAPDTPESSTSDDIGRIDSQANPNAPGTADDVQRIDDQAEKSQPTTQDDVPSKGVKGNEGATQPPPLPRQSTAESSASLQKMTEDAVKQHVPAARDRVDDSRSPHTEKDEPVKTAQDNLSEAAQVPTTEDRIDDSQLPDTAKDEPAPSGIDPNAQPSTQDDVQRIEGQAEKGQSTTRDDVQPTPAAQPTTRDDVQPTSVSTPVTPTSSPASAAPASPGSSPITASGSTPELNQAARLDSGALPQNDLPTTRDDVQPTPAAQPTTRDDVQPTSTSTPAPSAPSPASAAPASPGSTPELNQAARLDSGALPQNDLPTTRDDVQPTPAAQPTTRDDVQPTSTSTPAPPAPSPASAAPASPGSSPSAAPGSTPELNQAARLDSGALPQNDLPTTRDDVQPAPTAQPTTRDDVPAPSASTPATPAPSSVSASPGTPIPSSPTPVTNGPVSHSVPPHLAEPPPDVYQNENDWNELLRADLSELPIQQGAEWVGSPVTQPAKQTPGQQLRHQERAPQKPAPKAQQPGFDDDRQRIKAQQEKNRLRQARQKKKE